jgi:hypothetical protein
MDNYFQTCPPMMNDQGRHLTDFRSETCRNEFIKYVNDIYRDDQYRLFLQLNGKEIMDNEWKYNKQRNSCWVNDCVHKYPTRSNPRHFVQEMEAYNSIFDIKTNKKMAPMRECYSYKDYRLSN